MTKIAHNITQSLAVLDWADYAMQMIWIALTMSYDSLKCLE